MQVLAAVGRVYGWMQYGGGGGGEGAEHPLPRLFFLKSLTLSHALPSKAAVQRLLFFLYSSSFVSNTHPCVCMYVCMEVMKKARLSKVKVEAARVCKLRRGGCVDRLLAS